MAFTEEDKVVIKDIAMTAIHDKKLQTEKMCDEKMDNMEGDMKVIRKQLWFLIAMVLGLAGKNIYAGLM
jgi:hypothetical protein